MFAEQKKKALTDSSSAILTLLDYLMTIVDDLEKESDLNKETLFKEFMKVELMCGSRGEGGGHGVRTPLKNHKNIGFLCNTGPGPLKNHKAA